MTGGGRAAPGEPVHKASPSPVGCAPADRHSAGWAALQPPAPRSPEALGTPRLSPRGQEENAFFNCLFLNKLPRELHILLSEADKQAALCARTDLFATYTTNYCLAGLKNNKGLFSIRFPYCFQIPCLALEAFCYTMHNATTEPTVLLDLWGNIAGF